MVQQKPSIIKRIFNKKAILKFSVFIIALIIFVFLMDSVVMPFYTKHGEEYKLPDVTDKPVDGAIHMLEKNDFEPIIRDSVYDENFPPGTVVQQNPLPYSLVKEGRRVYLDVSIGEKPRFVPKLIGLTPQDAKFKLTEEGLNLNQVNQEFSDFYPRGVVMRQSISPGEKVRKNRRINITVSLGKAPTSLEVPNLVGKSVESARKELDTLGVRVGRIKYRYRSNLVPGTVLNQSVSAGKKLTAVDSIDLLVSTDQPPAPEEQDEDTTE